MNMQPAGKPDVDIWYQPTHPNYYKLLKAIKALGQDTSRFEEEKMPIPDRSFFKLNLDFCTPDLLPKIKSSIPFKEAFERREAHQSNEIKIDVLSLSDLLAYKAQMARAKDLIDIAALQKIQEGGKKQ